MQWDGIDEFLAVAESNSFSRAAEQLGLSNSQVSKRVAKLEARLGARLLYRTTRRVTLTDEGRQFSKQASAARDSLRAAEESIGRGSGEIRGTLRINLAGGFQEQFLVPLLAKYLQQNPALEMQLDFSDTPVNIVAEGYDLSICEGPLVDSSLGGKPLATHHRLLVASPDYLARNGVPAKPADLARHECLVSSDKHWILHNGRTEKRISVDGRWRSENRHALKSAALAGAGIASLPDFALEEDLALGTLVEVLAEWKYHEIQVWAAYPETRLIPRRVTKLIELMIEEWQLQNYLPLKFQAPGN